jgi:PAS domain S-box-containing protein
MWSAQELVKGTFHAIQAKQAMAHWASPSRTRLAVIRRYGIAVLSVAVALGLALLVRRFEGMAVASFLMAIALTVWYAGRGAGFLAIALSILSVDYFFLPPINHFTMNLSDLPYLAVFTLFGLVFSWFSASRRRTEQELRQVRKELEAKVAERTAELRRSEALLAEGERLTHTGTWALNPATKEVVFSSAETYRLFGFEPEKGAPSFEEWAERVHPKDRERVLKDVLARAVDYEVDFRTVLPDGTIRHIHGAGHPVFNASGDLVEFVGSAMDVTERKRTEEALRQTEYYLAEGERLTHTGSYAWNAASGLVYVSAELLRVFGFDSEEPAPPHAAFRQRVHPDDLAMFDALGEKSLREGADVDWVYRIVLPDGTVKHLHVVARPVLNASGEVVGNIGTTRDITERKRAERDRELLHQAEADLAYISRVTTMGELTASLAHEIKQPMAAAVTNANACLRWLTRDHPDMEEARAAASRMVKDVTRAADIISRIRLLFKKGESQRELLDVNEVIREMIVLLHDEATRHLVSIQTELADELPKVKADRVLLQQVFMNLMLNGIEAMKDTSAAGELTIKSRRAEDGQLLISIGDTGAGLPAEQPDQIFDAFFTTKPQGTGMGLPISRSIVESHGGRLWATSNGARGATFQFTLPCEVVAHQTA